MELFRLFGFLPVTLLDLVDVAAVSFLLYRSYLWLRRTAALQVVLVLLGLYILLRTVEIANLLLLRNILELVLQVGLLAAVIIFAPELRRALIALTQSPFFQQLRRKMSGGAPLVNEHPEQEEVISAIFALAEHRMGAILVLIRDTDLSHIAESGDRINARVSKRLLMSIFNVKSPLHDGAVLLRDGEIVAARTVLPVSDDPDIPPELGLRHRSALGITEVSDAGAIIASEETGKVAVALAGRLKRNLSEEELRQFLLRFYSDDKDVL